MSGSHLPGIRPIFMPSKDKMQKILDALIKSMFSGKRPAQGRRPMVIITVGVQGAGKSTAIKRFAPKSCVVIDPDKVTIALNGRKALPEQSFVYSLANDWTHEIVRYAMKHRFDFVYDTALPSRETLAAMKANSYTIKMLLVHTHRPIARGREVRRDLARGWGRPGIGLVSHRSTRNEIAKRGPELARKYVDELTVCDNSGKVMKCAPCSLHRPEMARMFQM